ncbi:MAG: hypothetical protein J0M07_24060 [Anaerolineae bacterium]|nr:hypothetical protein [Anaerolineae bacterium]
MPNLFFATLGQRPEAITIAYDRLCERYTFEQMIILATDRRESGIADAAAALERVCRRDYPDLPLLWRDLTFDDDLPLLDIHDASSALAYYRAVYGALAEWKQERYTLHMLISGGRKAMSVYATLAAGLVFGTSDHLWTVLSAPPVLKPGMFHIPAHMRDQVQVVELPLLTARVIPGSVPAAQLDFDLVMRQRTQARDKFLTLLTDSERAIAQILAQDRYVLNQQVADTLHVSRRTVESHLLNMYTKLASFVDFGDQIQNKRQALIDFLREGL